MLLLLPSSFISVPTEKKSWHAHRAVLDDGVLVGQVDGAGLVLRQVPVDVDVLQQCLATLQRLADLHGTDIVHQ